MGSLLKPLTNASALPRGVAAPASPSAKTGAASDAGAPSSSTAATPLVQGARDSSDYYGPAQGKRGAELLQALHSIVSTGHTSLGYDQARDGLFAIVEDPDSDDRVFDVYSDRAADGVNNRHNALEQKMNAEHTWPQSLGADGIAKSDLHQLMASDIEANSRRSSFPFGAVQKVEWETPADSPEHVSRLGTNAQGETVFEPRASRRGDIARALLYFFTRYNADPPPGFSLENFRKERDTLVQWHEADPVDEYERVRNEAVFKMQRNRNPYIDHPEFVQLVGDAFASQTA